MKSYVLDSEKGFPWVMEAEAGDGLTGDMAALSDWYRSERETLDAHLYVTGGVLLRGFGVANQAAFQAFVDGLRAETMYYVDGNSPRTHLGKGVYTSTEFPPDHFISLHNELSYAHQWPARLLFCCTIAPERGGETPLVDCRAFLQALDPAIRNAFEEKGVKYLRNLHGGGGAGPSWQQTFETDDRTKVEAYCRAGDTQFEWRGDHLHLSQLRPGVRQHPVTGDKVWFNQADQFHPSNNAPEVYEAMQLIYEGREREMPQHAFFGDDSEIPPAMLDEIRRAMREQALIAPWRQGDVLIVDNMRLAHGRMPFEGPRKVLVSMY